MLKELSQWLAAQSGLELGTDLLVGYFPDDAPARCSLVRQVGSEAKVYGASRERSEWQVLVRADNPADAQSDADGLKRLFRIRGSFELPVVTSGEAWTVESIDEISGPSFVGRDALGAFLYSVRVGLHAGLNN